MQPKRTAPEAPPPPPSSDRGLRFLEDKLSIYVNGHGPARRNPALDVLTGRVADLRLQPLATAMAATAAAAPAPSSPSLPATVVLPRAAVQMAAVARARRAPVSPWLQPCSAQRPRLRLSPPPRSRAPWWSRLLSRLCRWLQP